MTGPREALLVTLLLAAAGCSVSGGSSQTTSTGAGAFTGTGTGGSNGGCLIDACVPPLSTPLLWDVEIAPPGSSSAALTQLLDHDISSAVPYQASATTAVTVTVNMASGGGVIASTANVLLTIPPTIPGRSDLSFQAAAVPTADGRSATANLVVPAPAAGAAATLSFVPLPPSDQATPAYTFPVTVGATIAVSLPADDVTITGQLQTSVHQAPATTFVARAFQGNLQVSDAPLTQSDGTFQLRIPAANIATPITVELSPASTGSAAPVVVSTAFMASAGQNLGAITLPSTSSSLNRYNVVVTDGSAGVPGVVVRAQTIIGPATVNGATFGQASFAGNATTDASGIAALSLLPGSGNTALSYTITATPPAGSVYGTACQTMVGVVLGASTSDTMSAPTLQTIFLSTRTFLTGQIATAQGTPVPNLTVTATGAPYALPSCPAGGTISAGATTDANGVFRLALDPASYQLDYDPPSGSAAPRWTDSFVVSTGVGTVEHDVTLPQGALVTGVVLGPDGLLLPSTSIRFLSPQCSGQADCFGPARTPPLLRARAITDSTGSFRMVVPVDQP